MDPQRLLEQFLGAGAVRQASDAARSASSALGNAGAGGVAGGLAAGGLLGLLLGNKKARKTAGKLAGGTLGYGAAAALGAFGYRAYRQWQSGQAPEAAAGVPAAPAPEPPAKLAAAPAADGRPFELALIMAMIAAANADGHIGPDEQRAIFEQAETLALDAQDKAFIFDTLARPPSLADIAAMAAGPEQGAELYMASRLAIDVDHPAERSYLDALAGRLGLPATLVATLEAQAASVEQG